MIVTFGDILGKIPLHPQVALSLLFREPDLDATKVGVQAVECLYIDDGIENDAVAARAAGWRGVWLNRTGMVVAPNGIERVTSLLDVPFLLK